jgi:sialate O-acetylesterase
MPPELRESQLVALDRIPNSAMVVTLDIGDADDIHPTNKEPVGERLALAARALAYDAPIDYSGPLYETAQFEAGAAVVSFRGVGPGLVSGDGEPLRGFTLAGSDGVFHPAEAEISGEQVIVSSAMVSEPVAVRYGWANVPDGNLFNRAGLPASPFRSDLPD